MDNKCLVFLVNSKIHYRDVISNKSHSLKIFQILNLVNYDHSYFKYCFILDEIL